MAFSTLTIKLLSNPSNVTSTTVTLSSTDYNAAAQFCMQIPKNGGVIDNNGAFIPSSAIAQIVIS